MNDVWIFSLTDLRWFNADSINDMKPRCSFSSVIDKDSNKIFIFGGLSSVDTALNDLVSIKLELKIKEIEEK